MKRVIFATIIASAVSAASASNWYILFDLSEGKEATFVDAETFTREGDIVSVWTNQSYNPKFRKVGDAASVTSKWVYDCRRRTMQMMSYTGHAENGSVLFSKSTPEPVREAIPDSNGAKRIAAVCEKGFPVAGATNYYPTNSTTGAAAKLWFDSFQKNVGEAKAAP